MCPQDMTYWLLNSQIEYGKKVIGNKTKLYRHLIIYKKCVKNYRKLFFKN